MDASPQSAIPGRAFAARRPPVPGTNRLGRRAVLVSVAAILPTTSRAQQSGRRYRVGVLAAGPPPTGDVPIWTAFVEGLREHGYDGAQVLEPRFADGDTARLPGLAAELVAAKVDVIVVLGPAPMSAARAATQRIPIVMVAGSADPVGEGLIQSFARPGGNVTGLTYAVSPERFAKQLEVMKELLGGLARVCVLWDFDLDTYQRVWAPALAQAAAKLGLEIQEPVVVRDPADFEPVLAALPQRRTEAVLIAAGAIIYQNRQRLADLALRHRIPMMAAFAEFARIGILVSYGPDFPAMYRRSAAFVDRILRGTAPGEIPVEQPSKYELAINLRTAGVLGITVPPSLLVRADEVIE